MTQQHTFLTLIKVWEIFKPDEGRGKAQDGRAALMNAAATVEWISAYIEVRGHEGGCTGAGYAQGCHGLTAQELSDARA